VLPVLPANCSKPPARPSTPSPPKTATASFYMPDTLHNKWKCSNEAPELGRNSGVLERLPSPALSSILQMEERGKARWPNGFCTSQVARNQNVAKQFLRSFHPPLAGCAHGRNSWLMLARCARGGGWGHPPRHPGPARSTGFGFRRQLIHFRLQPFPGNLSETR
jgi:hypothetical protein